MNRRKDIALRNGTCGSGCSYAETGRKMAAVAALLGLPHFIYAGIHTNHPGPYVLVSAAAGIAALSGTLPMRIGRMGGRLAVFLYACYYADLSIISFGAANVLNRSTVSSLFLSTLKLGAAAVLMVALLLRKRATARKTPAYWEAIKSSSVIGLYSDVLTFGAAFLTLDGDVLMNTYINELMVRMVGELWLAVVVLLVMQPAYVTINYRRIKRAFRDYALLVALIAPASALLMFLFLKTVRVTLIFFCASVLGAEIVSLKDAPAQEGRSNKERHGNYIKAFYAKKWACSYYEIRDIAGIQKRLGSIEEERRWMETMCPQEHLTSRWRRLNKEEQSLRWKLFWRYSLSDIPD